MACESSSILWPNLPKATDVIQLGNHLKKRTLEELKMYELGKIEGVGHRNNLSIFGVMAAAGLALESDLKGEIKEAYMIPAGVCLGKTPFKYPSIWVYLAFNRADLNRQIEAVGHSFKSLKMTNLEFHPNNQHFMRMMWSKENGMTAHWLTKAKTGIPHFHHVRSKDLKPFFEADQQVEPELVGDRIWVKHFMLKTAKLLLDQHGSIDAIRQKIGTSKIS